MTVNRWEKAGAIISNTILVLLITVALLLAFVLLQGKLTGSEPTLAGYRLCIVRSGSMAPALKVGSVIALQPPAAGKIQPGDVITYRSESGGSLITHRVAHLETTANNLLFYTKGDANNISDPHPVPKERLVGKVIFTLPYLGYLLAYSRTRGGLAVLLVPAAMIAAAGLLRRPISRIFKKKEHPVKGVRSK